MNTIELLNNIMFLQTPLVQSTDDKRILLKLEGGTLNYNHKFRSAAYLVKKSIQEKINLSKVADRSSGSWAMALAYCINLAGGKTKFVTVKKPHPYLESFVTSKNGSFKQVENNSLRISELNRLIKEEKFFSFDQHNNLDLIQAFQETIGTQLVKDLNKIQIKPKYIVSPVGTGALLAGMSLALKKAGFTTEVIGCDISSSIVNQIQTSPSYAIATCRGVGSEDEICGTFQKASEHIDKIYISNIYNILFEMKHFTQTHHYTVGMSTCLALAVTKEHLLPKCGENEHIVILSSDRGEIYTQELHIAQKIKGIS